MQLRLIQIASSLLLIAATLIGSSANAKDVPVLKSVTLEIPQGEYSILKFPFKITNLQLGEFRGHVKKKKKDSVALPNNGVKRINISKTNGANKPKVKNVQPNILNLKRVDNILTFRPKIKGFIEIIVWGNKAFPMVLKINIVNKNKGDTDINFVQVLDKRDEVIKFESSAHEQVIERITRYLYNPVVNKKPRGYEEVVRKDIYDVGIENSDGKVIARVRASLVKESVGRRYVGQVWNANIVPEFESGDETITIPDGFYLTLYPEMFDAPGVFAVSLETYRITKKHGTRVMVVRRKEEQR
ncbi:hypothetical protein [Sulfurimonas sp.]